MTTRRMAKRKKAVIAVMGKPDEIVYFKSSDTTLSSRIRRMEEELGKLKAEANKADISVREKWCYSRYETGGAYYVCSEYRAKQEQFGYLVFAIPTSKPLLMDKLRHVIATHGGG